MKKNDVIILTITALTNNGDGLGRYDGIAVFVPGTAVSDVCEVIIIKMLSNTNKKNVFESIFCIIIMGKFAYSK